MGGGNSVPVEIQGSYKEEFKDYESDPKWKKSWDCAVSLKENSYELTMNEFHIENKEGGGVIKTPNILCLWGNVEEHGDMKKGDEIVINFVTKRAAASEKGKGGMGIPMPSEEHMVNFKMKYEKFNKDGVEHHSLVFVTHPKMQFEHLTGRLLGKKVA